MTTFREAIYMVLDLLKEHSDDAYFTEDHVMSILVRMRALLLEKKYKQSRNTPFSAVSDENTQEIRLALTGAAPLPSGCYGPWLRSVLQVPDTLSILEPRIYIANGLVSTVVTMVPPERMPYVGYNKWLKNFVYGAKSPDGYLYLYSNNAQFINMDSVNMEAVFSHPDKIASYMCVKDGGCDLMDATFPLEQSLLSACIEYTVQELSGARFAPEDKRNNGKDDFSEAGVTTTKPSAAAREQRESEEE